MKYAAVVIGMLVAILPGYAVAQPGPSPYGEHDRGGGGSVFDRIGFVRHHLDDAAAHHAITERQYHIIGAKLESVRGLAGYDMNNDHGQLAPEHEQSLRIKLDALMHDIDRDAGWER